MKYLQRLGKSLMLPVACLPVAAILMGIGYWIDPVGWGANNVLAVFLIKAGGALIDNMAILFVIGVSIGMSDDQDGTAAMAGMVSWLMITTLLSTNTIAMFRGIDIEKVPEAFGKIQTQFIGILTGIIGASCYNKFKNIKLPEVLSFFSGKRCVAIVTAGVSICVTIIFYFIWPFIYNSLVSFGKIILSTGAIGAGIYGFLNRLLIPFGLHHALNSVFWFDVAGINDIGKFWGTLDGGVYGQTGRYLSGYFPVMMFGLPAAALAMYHTAKHEKKSAVKGLLLTGALAAFFTGVTEPLEFAFMFLAPGLYILHAVLTGIIMVIVSILPFRSGFNFSAGFIDWVLSFRAPYAQNPWLLIPIGIVTGIIYYVIFKIAIVKFNIKTPGREDDKDEIKVQLKNDEFTDVARIILEGIGGKENIQAFDYCVTRLRFEVNDATKVKKERIQSVGIAGVIQPSKTTVLVVVGTKVQFVAEEIKKLCN